eukprot:scaffold67474_cov45-Phaeocystis_antarctica.AAC.1
MECGSVIVDAQGDPFALALARGAARGEVLTLVGEGEEEVTLRAAAGEVAPALRALVLGGPLVAVSRAGQGHGLRIAIRGHQRSHTSAAPICGAGIPPPHATCCHPGRRGMRRRVR